ncbi:hypothetical protein HanPSC8_Chr11g0450351 [Helianthus annuus]|nr:hypothetical protein HanPSC8_Chr11g0450351 [Helianthus annuus]
MALTTRNLADQLATIAAQLDAILASLRDDVDEIKAQMIGDGCNIEESRSDLKKTVEMGIKGTPTDEELNKEEPEAEVLIQKSRTVYNAGRIDVPDCTSQNYDQLQKDFPQKLICHENEHVVLTQPLPQLKTNPEIEDLDPLNLSREDLTKHRDARLSPRFFGPYRVFDKVDPIVYECALPQGSCIHPIIHITMFKAARRQLPASLDTSQPTTKVLNNNGVQETGQAIMEWLIAWYNSQ